MVNWVNALPETTCEQAESVSCENVTNLAAETDKGSKIVDVEKMPSASWKIIQQRDLKKVGYHEIIHILGVYGFHKFSLTVN